MDDRRVYRYETSFQPEVGAMSEVVVFIVESLDFAGLLQPQLHLHHLPHRWQTGSVLSTHVKQRRTSVRYGRRGVYADL